VVNDTLLQQLKDIHYPKPIGFWPMAKGWWLGLLILIIIVFSFGYLVKWWHRYMVKRQFLQELNTIQSGYIQDREPQKALSQLAILLKRVALTYYPRAEVASLYGQEWVRFLQSTGPEAYPKEWELLFTKALYQSQVDVEIDSGFKFARLWIRKQGVSCTS
jgi:hypothetical protein